MMFGIFTKIRNTLYDIGFIPQIDSPYPIISIGNISVGGTGKTPSTIMIASLLREHGIDVSLLSSGYKRTGKGEIIVLKNNNLLSDISPQLVGDEVFLHAITRLYHTVISNQPKYNSIQSFSSTVLIDDGFQHRKIHRDLDIVLVNQNDLEDRLLPFGRLREPIHSLNRADIILCTDDTPEELIRPFMKQQALFARIAFIMGQPYTINGSSIHHDKQDGVMAISGIANPKRFLETLKNNGFLIQYHHWYEDHVRFTENDAINMCKEAAMHSCKTIVITEKDYVKLQAYKHIFTSHTIQILVIPIIANIIEGKQSFEQVLLSVVSHIQQHS